MTELDAAGVRLAGRGEEQPAHGRRQPVADVQRGQRIDAQHAHRILHGVADADHRGQHVHLVPAPVESIERTRVGQVRLDERHVRAGEHRRQLAIAATAREVVDDSDRVTALGRQPCDEVIADEPRTAEDEHPTHSRCPHTGRRSRRARARRRGCASSRTRAPVVAARPRTCRGPAARNPDGP